MKYEEKLLIDICKGEIVDSIDYSQVDWKNLLLQATIHRVTGVLYGQFRTDRNAPRWFRSLVKKSYYYNSYTGTQQSKHFFEILSAFTKAGLTVLVLKGMYLVPCLYRDYGVRSFSDLDILVKRTEVESVFHILEDKFGYVQGEYNSQNGEIIPCPDHSKKERSAELQHESPFIKIDNTSVIPLVLTVEVHCRLETIFDPLTFNVEPLFKNKKKYNLKSGWAYTLSPEDMLIHLCYHNYWHTQSIQDIYNCKDILLRQYMDIRLFIKRSKINWEKVLSLYNTEFWLPISFSLYFCNEIFGDVLSTYILEKIDKCYLEDEEKKIYDRWITKYAGVHCFGKFECSFLDRIFSLDRYDTAISSCDFGPYKDRPDVLQYFEFFSKGSKIFLLDNPNKV